MPCVAGGGEAGRGGEDQDGEHPVREPAAQGEVRRLRQVRHEDPPAVGRRCRLQELQPGRAGQEGGHLHQRQPEERVPQEVHGQIYQVVGPPVLACSVLLFKC